VAVTVLLAHHAAIRGPSSIPAAPAAQPPSQDGGGRCPGVCGEEPAPPAAAASAPAAAAAGAAAAAAVAGTAAETAAGGAAQAAEEGAAAAAAAGRAAQTAEEGAAAEVEAAAGRAALAAEEGAAAGAPPVAQSAVGVADEEALHGGRRVLHVQSTSSWAPSCIGPYSQVCVCGGYNGGRAFSGKMHWVPRRCLMHRLLQLGGGTCCTAHAQHAMVAEQSTFRQQSAHGATAHTHTHTHAHTHAHASAHKHTHARVQANAYRGLIHVAGSIPLVPATMALPAGDAALQALLALANAQVGKG